MLNLSKPNKSSAPLLAHPSLWRASELARSAAPAIATGYSALSAALPGGGWPGGSLIELLLAQPGVGELRLLRPALCSLGPGPIVLMQPPHVPNALAWAGMRVPPSQLIWLRSSNGADALWAAEQILRSGSCGALLFWLQHARGSALRRLHLAAQHGSTLFCMMRPLATRQDASPAVLRLSLQAASDGLQIGFIKRRGPQREAPLFLPLQPSPVSLYRHASVDRPAFAPASAGSILPDLVN